MNQVKVKNAVKPQRKWLKIIGQIHLWLGLVVGSVIVVISLAASVFVFENELTDFFYEDVVIVHPGKERKPVSQMLMAAENAMGGKVIDFLYTTDKVDHAWMFVSKKYNPKAPGYFYFSEYERWHRVFVNPYTAKVTGVMDMRYEPVYLFRVMHQQLLLRYQVGHLIVAISSLVFILMIISGLILWFPKNKAAFKQRFKIKWNAKFKRLNHDLHNVGGFYVQPFLLILIITGLIWSFRWWQQGINFALGVSTIKAVEVPAPPAFSSQQVDGNSLDNAVSQIFKRYQNKHLQELSVILRGPNHIVAYSTYWDGSILPKSDELYYDVTNGKEFFTIGNEQMHAGQKLRNLNYPIHVGSLCGWPTKILAFMVCLFSASLPITGLLIWLGRKKKNQERKLSLT